MNFLVIPLVFAILGTEYLVRERGLLHPYVVLLPELLACFAMLVVMARVMAGSRISLDRRYAAFLIVSIVTMVFAYVIQDVPAGPMVAGIREHLKFIPFFLLPAVYRFSAAQLRTIVLVVFAFFLLQMPLAIYQRFFEYANMMNTGDPVRGTATTSSALSMLMMCGIATVVSLYLRRRLGLVTTFLLIGVLFLPTTLNETKATLLMLPVAILAPAFFMPRGQGALRRLTPVLAIGCVTVVAFVAVYDYFISYNSVAKPIGQFVGEGGFTSYLYSGAAEEGANYIGRFDSLEFAWQHITQDPFKFAFGYGPGNVAPSSIPAFDGQFAAYYERYGVGMTQVTTFLWEIGVLGLLAFLALYAFVLRDAWSLARAPGEDSVLGQVWSTVILIMTFGLIYKSVFSMSEIGFLFWFFTGVVAGRAIDRRRALSRARPDSARVAQTQMQPPAFGAPAYKGG